MQDEPRDHDPSVEDGYLISDLQDQKNALIKNDSGDVIDFAN